MTRDNLSEIDRKDRIKFCKADFEQSIAILKKNKKIWCSDVLHEVSDINNIYFNMVRFAILSR